MIRFLITCCVLLFPLLTANAQSLDLPQCSPDQFDRIAELSPEISAIEDDMGRIESMADVLRVNAAHLRLRQKLWDDLQLCDVYLEFTSLFSARFNDVFAVSALEGISPGQEESPRWKLVEGIDGEARNLILANLGEYVLAGLIPGSGDSPTEPLAACSETQWQYARGAKLTGYIEILNQALAVETVEDLLRYDVAHFDFRESAWVDLPRCADAYEVASLMFRISGDFVVAHALAILGIPAESNPYIKQIAEDVARLPAWMIPPALRDPDDVYALFGSSLPSCTAGELAWALNLRHPLLGPDGELGERFLDEANRSDLKVQAIAEISWRDRHFADAPRCREALEITLAMSEIGSDIVAAAGFSLAVVPDPASLYRKQATLGAARLRTLLADYAEASEHSGASQVERNGLPSCTADQVKSMVEPVAVTWREMEHILPTLEARADFVRYATAQFKWRRNLLQRLPPCDEAVELSLMLHKGAGVIAGIYALDYADVVREDNPYLQQSDGFAADTVPLLTRMQLIFQSAE